MAIREVIFRGKRADNGEWVEGGYIPLDVDSGYEYIVEPCNYASTFSALDKIKLNSILVLPETVGQYTGLTVANGKVFDRDIIRFGSNLYLVFWNGEAFQWQAKRIDTDLEIHRTCGGCYDFDWTITDLGWIAAEPILIGEMTTEIIGNIHDNPELLEGHDDNA